MVTLYSKSDCQPCRLTARALNAKGIEFREEKVDESPEALARIKELGYLQAPVVFVSEDNHWSGLQPDKINQL